MSHANELPASPASEEAAKAAVTGRCLTFEAGGLSLFISTEYVVEIITGHAITALPLSPSYILGIINLRGQILTVMDLQAYMGSELVTFTPETCIIVLNIDSTQLGIVVDSVHQVTDIDLSRLKSIPVKRQHRLLNGMVTMDSGDVLMSLDCQALVNGQAAV